jgi:hypothetical protein
VGGGTVKTKPRYFERWKLACDLNELPEGERESAAREALLRWNCHEVLVTALKNLAGQVELCLWGVTEFVELQSLVAEARDALKETGLCQQHDWKTDGTKDGVTFLYCRNCGVSKPDKAGVK